VRKRRFRLTRLEVLEFALDGAMTFHAIRTGSLTEEEEEFCERAIAELERRIKLSKIQEERRGPR